VNLYGIVVAAGRGERFGSPKADLVVQGLALWQWAAAALEGSGSAGVIVVGAVPGGVPGGARRRDSVASADAAIAILVASWTWLRTVSNSIETCCLVAKIASCASIA